MATIFRPNRVEGRASSPASSKDSLWRQSSSDGRRPTSTGQSSLTTGHVGDGFVAGPGASSTRNLEGLATRPAPSKVATVSLGTKCMTTSQLDSKYRQILATTALNKSTKPQTPIAAQQSIPVSFEVPAFDIIKNKSSKTRALYPFYILVDVRKFRSEDTGGANPLLLSKLPSLIATPVLRGSTLATYVENAYWKAPAREMLRHTGHVDGTGVPPDPSQVPAQPAAPRQPAWRRAKQSIDRRLAQAADRSRYVEIFPLGGTVPMPVPNLVNIQGKLTEKHTYSVSDLAAPKYIAKVRFIVPANCWPRASSSSILYTDNTHGQQDCPIIALKL